MAIITLSSGGFRGVGCLLFGNFSQKTHKNENMGFVPPRSATGQSKKTFGILKIIDKIIKTVADPETQWSREAQ